MQALLALLAGGRSSAIALIARCTCLKLINDLRSRLSLERRQTKLDTQGKRTSAQVPKPRYQDSLVSQEREREGEIASDGELVRMGWNERRGCHKVRAIESSVQTTRIWNGTVK